MPHPLTIYRARHYVTQAWIDVHVRNKQIVAVQPAHEEACAEQADWITPTFFDVQINGGGGVGFTSLQLNFERIRWVVLLNQSHGIGAFAPTVVTNSFAVMQHSFEQLAQACHEDSSLAKAMPVFHMEGPYISPENGPRGAHPLAYVRLPDETEYQKLQEAAHGRIRLLTMAPELQGAIPFIERRVREGLIVSIGHSAAEPAVIRAAVQAGARLSTHLGNGCHRLLPRHPNLLWEQLAADDLTASLITDGHHLPWSIIQCFIRMKTPKRIIITCDVSEMGGLPPGRYGQWDQEIEVLPEGKIVLCDQGVLAGSWSFTDTCVSRLVATGIVNMAAAMAMASQQPRQLLNLPIPTLAAGEPADFILWSGQTNEPLRLQSTFIDGRRITPAPTCAWGD